LAQLSAAIGARAEAAVRNSLIASGWSILASKWRGGGGELDVVALRDGVLRIVEVKARARRGQALEAVSRSKQRRISRAAAAFLASRPELEPDELSFCVATIEAGVLSWYEDAFDDVGGALW
jgi:putative endonuclease